ncbi:MAG: argininosuccinate lyase, partial [Rhizobacter sp.]|nr:argininosuccinate lyase [Rhizobacter sp.]
MEEQQSGGTQRLWGARFKSEPSAALKALSRSEPSFFRLVPYDLAGSRAHARELQRAGILTAAEVEPLMIAIDAVEREYAAGELHPSEGDEDVHTFLERVLTLRLGAIGGKLRAGRS